MLAEKNAICVKLPEKVFFSNYPDQYIVKNNFDITVYKTTVDSYASVLCPKIGGEAMPTIYILGLEQLFEEKNRQQQMDSFLKMFYVQDRHNWDICYGKFPDTGEYCAVITASAVELPSNFSISFLLSDKCTFTAIPEAISAITLQVIIDDFDCFFSDVPKRMKDQVVLQREFAVYIDRLEAYLDSDPQTPVQAVYKGSAVNITWKIEQNERAAAFLYDENGAVVANLPPYTVTIDQDRRFKLVAYNEFCSVTRSIEVYRTLWRKMEQTADSFPKTDPKGRCKIYWDADKSYLYVHPNLYQSSDLSDWKLCSTIPNPPEDFIYYSSAYSFHNFGVCYMCSDKSYYYEMNWYDKTWKKFAFDMGNIKEMYAFPTVDRKIIFGSEELITMYDCTMGRLINPEFLFSPKGTRLIAMDTLQDGEKQYLAALYDNNRAYFYNLGDDDQNNIFECPQTTSSWLYLVKSNAVYLALDGYMLEAHDRQKFTDLHFMPPHEEGVAPILGGVDAEQIVGLFSNGEQRQQWQYKF